MISILERLKQEDSKFKASLNFKARPCLQTFHTKVFKGLQTSTDLPDDPETAIKMGKYMVGKRERKRSRIIQML